LPSRLLLRRSFDGIFTLIREREREEKREKGREREEKFSFSFEEHEQASSPFHVFSFFSFFFFVGKKSIFRKTPFQKEEKKYGKPLAI